MIRSQVKWHQDLNIGYHFNQQKRQINQQESEISPQLDETTESEVERKIKEAYISHWIHKGEGKERGLHTSQWGGEQGSRVYSDVHRHRKVPESSPCLQCRALGFFYLLLRRRRSGAVEGAEGELKKRGAGKGDFAKEKYWVKMDRAGPIRPIENETLLQIQRELSHWLAHCTSFTQTA